MPYTSTFHDNAVYGASDINDALAQLVTSGIADPFTDGAPYNAKKLNGIIYAVSSAGVVPATDSSCKCTVDKTAHTVHIAPGTAFFDDGSRITFDIEGETLSYAAGIKQYVYLMSAPAENRCYPVCSATEPSGDYVMLAEISPDGTLTDKRTYARGKLPGYQSNVDTVMRIDDTIVLNAVSPGAANYGPAQYTISLGTNNYTTLLYQAQYALAVYDIVSGNYLSLYLDHGEYYANRTSISIMAGEQDGFYQSVHAYAVIEKSGNELHLTLTGRNNWSSRPETMNVPLSFTIF